MRTVHRFALLGKIRQARCRWSSVLFLIRPYLSPLGFPCLQNIALKIVKTGNGSPDRVTYGPLRPWTEASSMRLTPLKTALAKT